MAGSELVENYRDLVDKYDLLRQRIAKANEQRERFKSTVVAKVLADYERQARELEDQLVPCEAEMYRLVSGLETEQARVEAQRSELEEKREEIELRNLIGEFADGEYDQLSNELSTGLENVNQKLVSFREELASYHELMARAGAEERKEAAMALLTSGASARPVERVVAGPVVEEELEPFVSEVAAPVQPVQPPVHEVRLESPVAASTPVVPPTPVASLETPDHATVAEPVVVPPRSTPVPTPEPVFGDHAALNGVDPIWGGRPTPVAEPTLATSIGSSAFDDAFGTPGGAPDAGGNAFEMILDDLPPMSGEAGLDRGLTPFGGTGMDDLQGLTELDNQWQKDLADDFPPSSAFHDVLDAGPSGVLNERDFPNIGFGPQDTDLPPLGLGPTAQPHAAYLIRREGRPDEDRYEIRDDVTSIGRGRDNQIQIKDDTKVSRYHCRVLREQAGYFIEDNNSSNGTMVNGELITRRKIEGGEELTIGETAFRFLVA